MAGEFKGLTIKFKGDASDLSAALSRINKDMRITTRSGMEVNRILAMKGASGNVKLLAQNVKIAGDRCKEWQTRLDVLREAQENLGERTVENAAQYDHLTEQIERAEARLDAYTQQLHEAEAAYDRSFTKLGQFGQKLKDLGGHWQTLGQGMQDTGATLTRTVTAPLVALGTVSVKSAVEVDSALTGVRKTLDATEDQYQKLKDAAIESSKQQPVDAATILNIEALGAQLGFGIDELQEFARVASGLDVSTDMGWEDAATNMAQFANIMKMSHGDVGRYASTIVDLGNHFATTESAVSDMGMRIAAAGAQLGMSEADVLGLAGALTSMGVTAEAGGSAISTIMSNIDKDVAMGNENMSLWAETAGMSAQEFATAWGNDPVDALARVLSGLADASEEGSSMAVMLDDLGIGSIRQTDVMKRLAGNTELMTDAVGRANAAWKENTALDTEVANRNESLASKFQVLGNKLTAIAIDIGGPLVDALLDVVDAAEPLIQKVSDMAKAFADMETEEQRNIIKHAAMAAAAGPLLTIFGKLTSGVGTFATGLGDGALKLATFAGQIKRGNGFTTALTTSFEGASTAVAGLQVVLGALAIAAVAGTVKVLYDEMTEADRDARNLADAMDGVNANTEGLAAAFTTGTDSLGQFGEKAGLVKSDVDGLLDSIRQHNERNAETRQSTSDLIGELEHYKDVIDRAAGAGEGYEGNIGELQVAVSGLNDILGTSYEVHDVLEGKYKDEAGEVHNLKDEIDELIASKEREARASALTEMAADTYKERVKAEKELEKAEQEYSEHWNSWGPNYIKELQKEGHTYEEAAEMAKDAFDNKIQSSSEYARNVKAAQKAVDELTEEEQTYYNMLGDLTEAENAHWGDREGIIMTTERMKEACQSLGYDVKELSQGLEDAGVSTEQFAQVGGDQFAMMAEMAGGNMDTLISLIQSYNEQEFEEKYGDLHVNGIGEVVDANGTIMEWNGTDFVPKYLEVTTNAGEAAGEVDTLNKKTDAVKDKDSKVEAKVNGKSLVDDLNKSINGVPKSTNVSMTAHTYGKGNVDTLLSTLANANGRTYDVYFNTHNTTYNKTVTEEVKRARGAIVRNHAAGDILMANRRGMGVMYDAENRIGEQGAEAIVPLQQPFANNFAGIIADAIAAHGGIGGVQIDYERLGQAVASAIAGMSVQMDGRELIGAIARTARSAARMYAG